MKQKLVYLIYLYLAKEKKKNVNKMLKGHQQKIENIKYTWIIKCGHTANKI